MHYPGWFNEMSARRKEEPIKVSGRKEGQEIKSGDAWYDTDWSCSSCNRTPVKNSWMDSNGRNQVAADF